MASDIGGIHAALDSWELKKTQGMHNGTFQHRAPWSGTCYAGVLWNVVENSEVAGNVLRKW